MDEIPLVKNQEFVHQFSLYSEGNCMMLRTDKNSVSQMMHLVGKFTNQGELVVDCIKGT